MSTFAIILPAAGKSSRFGDPKQKKIYADLDGRAVWLRALDPFLNREDVSQIIVAIASEDRELFERRYRPTVAFLNIQVVDGGAERYETVAKALELVDPACEFVAVHDAARPCLSVGVVDAVFAAARQHGAALPGVAVADTLKRVSADSIITETVSRNALVAVQTPQAFRLDWLLQAYANRRNVSGVTDDAQLVEAIGHSVRVVEGSPFNVKITAAADLRLASAILQAGSGAPKEAKANRFGQEEEMWA